jgi:translocation and assembly module TamB
MDDEALPPEPETQTKRKRRWLFPVIGTTAVLSGAALGVGPLAPYAVDYIADGARIWRLGELKIDGVQGSWLGDLRAERIALEDEEGEWIEARGVTLEWRPLDVLFGDIRLNVAHADSILMHRQPRLLDPRPPSGRRFDVRIGDLSVETIQIAEAAYGIEAQFTADLSLLVHDQQLRGLNLNLERTDSDADRVIAVYQRGAEYALNVDAVSAPETGIIARALGIGEHGLTATARGDGDVNQGSSTFNVNIGEASLLAGTSEWAQGDWSLDANAQLDVLPMLTTLARRIGASAAFRFAGDPSGAFTAHGQTPFLAVDLAGALNEDQELDGPARIVATTDRLSSIARESPFELGPARLEGELRQARGTTAIRGTLDAQQVDVLGRRVRLTGPVEAALTDAAFNLSGDLRAGQGAPPLFANARLRTDLAYDRRRHRFELAETELTSEAITVTAQGWVNGGDGEFAGEWHARRLEALTDLLSGEASGEWRAFAERIDGARIWTTAVAGRGANVDGSPDVIGQLLGRAPALDARLTYENRGITVEHARIDGAQLRAGATGRIVQGNANLAVEASARGPLSLGGAEITGAVDATGQLTGRLARPALDMRATLASFSAGGVVVDQPVIDFTLAPTPGGTYAGSARAEGRALGQAFNAASNVAIDDGVLSLTELDGQVGAMQAQGSASFAPNGVTAMLDVNGLLDGLFPGVSGRLAGQLALTPQTLALDAQIADARAGELRVRAATLSAQGPHQAIAARFDLRGRLREAPLAFEGTSLLDIEGDPTLSIEGRGTLAESDIFTRTPMRAIWRRGGAEASIDVAMGDGVVRAQWTDRGRSLRGSAQITDAPITPLAAIWGERATGRIDGQLSLANNGDALAGSADITLEDARFAGRQRGALDMRIVGDLDPGRLIATIDATSEDGLVAHFEANAPVTTSANPIRIALARERRGQARWSVHGPASSLWAAARLQDQSLEGQLDGEGELEFGAGYLSGDGHIEIVDGRFEDKLTGITLVDLDARVAIDQRGVTIQNFTASGPRGGRLTATGGSANEREGNINVRLDEMRVADRPDARAVASGELALRWEGLTSSLSGDLNIVEAEVDVAAADADAGIPTIDVIEINRPGDWGEDDTVDEAPTNGRNAAATELNVRIRAPGRVFTRGRGVDAEWSLDLRLQGTSRNPRLFGEARAIRGTLALSGQPFEIEDARIFFNGDPLDAQINLTAVRDTADLSARIRLTGTARDPEVTFSSDPPLPEDEILPQILFGRSVEDLSALEAAQLAASIATLTGNASLDIVDAARAAAGLDRFNVRQDENGGFLVAGGVYLTRNVYLEVARTGLGETQTRVEWTVRPRLVLITSFLGSGEQRVSLRWRRESD